MNDSCPRSEAEPPAADQPEVSGSFTCFKEAATRESNPQTGYHPSKSTSSDCHEKGAQDRTPRDSSK